MKKLVGGKNYNNLFKIMSALFIVLPLLIIDQLTKFIILKNLQPGDSIPIIKNVFHITFVCNKGAAFGVFSETASSIFIFVSSAAIITIIFTFIFFKKIAFGNHPKQFSKWYSIYTFLYHKKFFQKKKTTLTFLSLILAGAIGNLIDRIRFGYVVDFLDFRIWPVFNIADSAITIGTLLLILQMLKHKSVLSHKS